ncbi:MAG TPA: prepilin-type N-terminal cleavage/methylation domain-containing protein [Anaerohalosphaeraceae bacterium]|nr:prepilin-type N-terminal cleavage/methylation domain-containing protein [Phycisphaerae bacterium]HOK94640.1 prepilin-type N-terminal cleavage/methylation domain-containing protein [Anaerohalosphaeraceae bacterium]HOL30897.1 prepilin-type N-terminal cleavage/methylation domain-containing protein [Anaerohalosphaeraceae bacterium]HOM76037.1 prepilin-type N-terminal cleavage/methylation domain-containing protein [Anaerohalosphaeraceae bacterium]HPC64213.1 prepilin-type N-terminal cleavage/methyl
MKTYRQYRGFTLLEALFAAMLIGLVVVALVAASGAFTVANGYGVDLSTAEFLIEQVREMTTRPEVTIDGLISLDDVAWGPPKDAAGNTLPEFSEFIQKIDADYLQPGNLTQVSSSPTDFIRLTVTIYKNNVPISSTSWVRARLN